MFEQSYIDMPKLYSDLFEVCDTSGFVIESMKSSLRKKLRWLMKNVMCRSISDFKCNNVHYTTKYDYPIIFEILKFVVERSDNHIICRWLNDSLKTKKDSKHKIKYVFHKKENRCIIKVKEVHGPNWNN